MAEYVVKVQVDDSGIKDENKPIERKTEIEKSQSPTKKEPVNKSNDTMAMLRRATTIYALGSQAIGVGVSYQANRYSIGGDTLKAERLNTSFNNAKKGITTIGSIALSMATGNPLVIAATAYNLAQQAINLGLQNQMFQHQLNNERQRSAYYTDRLVRNISEVR